MRVVLEENRDCSTKIRELQRADVEPVDEYVALVRVIQSHCEFENSALSGTVRTNDDLVRDEIVMKI